MCAHVEGSVSTVGLVDSVFLNISGTELGNGRDIVSVSIQNAGETKTYNTVVSQTVNSVIVNATDASLLTGHVNVTVVSESHGSSKNFLFTPSTS